MAQSVSNDALWEKLSEINEQLSRSKQTENAPDLSGIKDEIIAKIESEADLVGNHSESCYKAINQNIATLDEVIRKVWNIVTRIRKQQKETAERQLEVLETQAKGNRAYFNFRFFKLRKTSVMITLLGLLVLILTLFCMKQQNDYALLINEHHCRGAATESGIQPAGGTSGTRGFQ